MLALTATIVAGIGGSTPADVADDPIMPMEPSWWSPPTEPTVSADGPRPLHATKVVFVNFDGGQANSSIYNGYVEPFNESLGLRASIIQTMRQRLGDFDFSITWERPQSGDYDTEWVGAWRDRDPGGAAGIAPAGDCWDQRGGETSFTMLSTGNSDSVAEVILQEIAHTWGLDHVDDVRDLLYPTTEGQNKQFVDECLQIVSDTDLNPSSGFCSHHQEACNSSSLQNSYVELGLIFGPSTADTVAPTVSITNPQADQTLTGEFDLSISLADDRIPAVLDTTIEIVDLDANNTKLASPSDYNFPIADIPEGTHTIIVSILDESGNMASDEVTFHYGQPGDWEPPEGGGDGGDGGDDGGDGGGDGGDGGGDAGGGDDGGDDGCGCSSDPAPVAVLSPMLLLLAARRRHRP